MKDDVFDRIDRDIRVIKIECVILFVLLLAILWRVW